MTFSTLLHTNNYQQNYFLFSVFSYFLLENKPQNNKPTIQVKTQKQQLKNSAENCTLSFGRHWPLACQRWRLFHVHVHAHYYHCTNTTNIQSTINIQSL